MWKYTAKAGGGVNFLTQLVREKQEVHDATDEPDEEHALDDEPYPLKVQSFKDNAIQLLQDIALNDS